MAEPIGPGDWIERDPAYGGSDGAISRDLITIREGVWPGFGLIFRVRDMRQLIDTRDRPYIGIRLVGIVADIPGRRDAYWPAEGFRPVYRPKAELIESLKAPPQRTRKRETA